MKLYLHPASPNCVTVVMTAAHLGIPLETELVDLFNGAQHEPDHLALNPNGAVPVLRDGDFVLWESSAICQYVASRRSGHSLWPEDERTRADIARWQFWALAHWNPALQPYVFENLFKGLRGLGDPDPAVLERAGAVFHRYARVLETRLDGRDHLVGRELTLADIAVAPYLMYAAPARIPLQGYPNLRRWMAGIEALPSWRAALPSLPLPN